MHSDLTFFTNDEKTTLLERFKSTLRNVETFDVLVGYFRTSGFYRLYESLEDIKKIRILVGINTDKKTYDLVQSAQTKFDFESHTKAKEEFSKNLTEEVYQSEDKYDVEVGIKKFIEFIQTRKLEIKAYPSKNLHAKVYISRFKEDDRDYGRVITGSSNFSEYGLNANYEFNVELKNSSDVRYAEDKFEELWKDAVDLSEVYVDTINQKTWLNDQITPYEIYIKFLYEYLKEEINADDDFKTYLPDGFMELKYQKNAVTTLKKIVDQYGGAFVADVVGLGKTYITAMYAQALPGKKLVICPPPIKDNWEEAFRDFGIRNFEVESIGRLEHIIRKGVERYDYVFVDEAHRFRNENTNQYQLLHQICLNKKILLISATPLNNSVYDFFSLLKLFQKPTDSDIPDARNLEAFFTNARQKLMQYDKSDPEYLEEVKRISKQVRDKILKHVMVRRTRTDVMKYFKKDVDQQGLFFPVVMPPSKIIYTFDEKTNITFNRTIALIKSLTYARYTAGLYIEAEQKTLSDFEKQQEINMAGFMKSRLVKRLESSKFAFEQTIKRFIESYEKFIEMYNNGTVYISKKINVYDYLENDNEDELIRQLEEEEREENKRHIIKKDEFNNKFFPCLMADLQMLKEIQSMWQKVERDFKLEAFIKELQEDNILNQNKLIIFTESKETGDNLFEAIQKDCPESVFFYSSNCGKYQGECKSSVVSRELIKDNFDPKSLNQKDDIRILISTDVLAEGINLHKSNIIINYDLPWNPTRVLQRVGRVNRVGTSYDKVHIYNFFPTSETDQHLGLEDNIKSKIQAFHETLGEDAKYLTDDEVYTNHKLFGEELYNKLNSKETYEVDEAEENVELKYLEVIKNIRDNRQDLYNKIKRLPKKARSCRKDLNLENNKLITFFRKGNLKKFYLSDGLTSKEIIFEYAVKLFECEEQTPKEIITKEYYSFLNKNKEAFVIPNIEEILPQKHKGGRSNEKYVMQRIEVALKDQKLTDTEEDFLKTVLKVFKDGILPKKISKKIKDEIEKHPESIKVLNSIKNNVPKNYLTQDEEKIYKLDDISEIILSEFLISGEN